MTELEVPANVRDLAARRAVAKGEVVFRVGTPARHVYFLLRGRVALHRFGPDGEEVPIHVAEAGEFFAEASMHADRYHCTAVALGVGDIAAIPSLALRAKVLSDPQFSMQWLETISAQLRRTRARVERLSIRSAAGRVRHLLVSEGRGKVPTYTLPGTVRELAAQLGLTHEALYRTLAEMQRSGIVERTDRAITLLR